MHLAVDDVDAVHAWPLSHGVAIDSGPLDQTRGARELYVKDADGNTIRFVQHRRG